MERNELLKGAALVGLPYVILGPNLAFVIPVSVLTHPPHLLSFLFYCRMLDIGHDESKAL